MKQYFLLAVIAGGLVFLTENGCFSGKPRSTDSLLKKLKANREKDEYYYITHSDDFIEFVKTPGVDTLIEVLDTLQKIKGHKLLDSPECTYITLKNPDGKLIYIDRMVSKETPFSFQSCVHYFDERGDTYAFQIKDIMYFDGDNPKLVIDDHVMYYNQDFRIVGETDTVKDTNHQIVNLTKDERRKMEFKYNIYKNLTDCLKGYRINRKK